MADDNDKTDFLATARKRFQEADEDERGPRTNAAINLRFVGGDQWPAELKAARLAANRPALTFSRCHTFVQQISNEARQNKSQIKFIPPDESRKEIAEIAEGMARQIQYESNAQVAYETAIEYSAGGSFGYYRFLTDYCDDDTFDQELKVVPVFDPFAVYGILIPSCFGLEPRYAFVVSEIPREEYKSLYPDSDITSFDAKQSDGWIGTHTIRVAEYWTVEDEKVTLTVGDKTREVIKKKVKCCKINGVEVLPDTETEWPGSVIPIVPVLGKQLIIDGEVKLFSAIDFQRDAQHLINVYKSRIAETIGTSPIQPYEVFEGQIEGHETEWATLNTKMSPTLTAKPVIIGGQLLPFPHRQVWEPPITALSQATAQEIDDMKATVGIFDASLGARSNEQSGLAIQRRQQQSAITNMHFMDNLERAHKKGGRIIAEVLPRVYDGARIVRILGPDEAPKLVKINQQFMENGQPKDHNIADIAKYDVVVSMGRAYSTKKSESFDMMAQVLQTSPDVLPMIGDIFFRNSDLAGADELAERFKKMLPPNLQDDKQGDPQKAVLQLQAQMQQAQQQLQALNAYAKQVEDDKRKLEQEKQAKVVDNQAKLEMAKLQNQLKIELERITIEFEKWKVLHQSAHEVALQNDQQVHEVAMAEKQQDADLAAAAEKVDGDQPQESA